MDATDFAIGILIIALLAWSSIIALNQGANRAAIADLYLKNELNKPLISLEETCEERMGFELVKPEQFGEEPYYITARTNDFNQTIFCFYKKDIILIA